MAPVDNSATFDDYNIKDIDQIYKIARSQFLRLSVSEVHANQTNTTACGAANSLIMRQWQVSEEIQAATRQLVMVLTLYCIDRPRGNTARKHYL